MIIDGKKCDACGRPKLSRPNDDPERQIESSLEQINNFLNSTLYKDYLAELALRTQKPFQILDDRELQYTGRHYDMARGGLAAFEVMVNIFNEIRDLKRENREEGE